LRLGIDFGTTRIVVAAVDRGNYPVIAFEDPEGVSREWFPPLIAARGSERLYGWDAYAAQADPSYTTVRSLKRTLEDAGPGTAVQAGQDAVPMHVLLEEMVAALRTALLERSSLPAKPGAPLEIMLGVPANANSNQRFLTVEPFLRAGFHVLGLLNEPSAASIEYGHRNRTAQVSERVLVYDLGGGTFDASLVQIEDRTHSVIASEGVPYLGGDDFDILLADLALEAAGISNFELTQGDVFRLHEEARTRKEALHPNTRRIVIDLGAVREGWSEVTVSAAEFYDRCRPLVQQTLAASEALLAAHDSGERLEAVYVTGGGSELPLVSRALKEVYGRKVRRSPYTRSATAIGLAIQADVQAGYVLRESFTRHFGVWREADAGRTMIFDPLFEKGTTLPGPGEPPLTIRRAYSPVHNVGHFRYLECSHLTPEGRPRGDIMLWDEIRFAFERGATDSDAVQHTREAPSQFIEERYECDASGAVTVTISNVTAEYSHRYRLGRWAQPAAADADRIVPGRRRRAAAKR
jgi:molecular chaperone DnaK (HSP70)